MFFFSFSIIAVSTFKLMIWVFLALNELGVYRLFMLNA